MSVFEEINLYGVFVKGPKFVWRCGLPAIEISGLSAGQFNKSLMEKEIQPEGKEKNKTKSRKGGKKAARRRKSRKVSKKTARRKKKSRVADSRKAHKAGKALKAESQAPQSMIVVTGYGVFKDGRLIGFDAKMARALNWLTIRLFPPK